MLMIAAGVAAVGARLADTTTIAIQLERLSMSNEHTFYSYT